MAVYKEGQGRITRIGAMCLSVLLGLYAGSCWYRWQFDIESARGVTADFLLNGAFIGAVVIFLGVCLLGLRLAFKSEKTSDFLIDVDVELNKVVWPEMFPLFDPKAEAWGATYVVIVTTIVMTIYIGIADSVLEFVIWKNFLNWLLG